MRFLPALAFVAVSVQAQPAVLSASEPALPRAPSADPSPSSSEAIRSNTLSIEAGGASAFVGVRYERAIGGPLRVAAGYSTFSTGDRIATRHHAVPATISAVYAAGGPWALDAGLGVTLALGIEEDGVYVDPLTNITFEGDGTVALQALWAPTVGARFEGRRVFGRVGGALLSRPPRLGESSWRVVPWPSLSAGVRF